MLFSISNAEADGCWWSVSITVWRAKRNQSRSVGVQNKGGARAARKSENGGVKEERQDFTRDLIGNLLLDSMSVVISHT